MLRSPVPTQVPRPFPTPRPTPSPNKLPTVEEEEEEFRIECTVVIYETPLAYETPLTWDQYNVHGPIFPPRLPRDEDNVPFVPLTCDNLIADGLVFRNLFVG